MIEVNESQYQQSCRESEKNTPFHPESEFEVKQHADESANCLEQGITSRNLHFAVPAPSAEKQVAQDRDVIVPADEFLAVRAMRPRQSDWNLQWNAENANVQKTSYNQSKDQCECKFHQRSIRNSLRKT